MQRRLQQSLVADAVDATVLGKRFAVQHHYRIARQKPKGRLCGGHSANSPHTARRRGRRASAAASHAALGPGIRTTSRPNR